MSAAQHLPAWLRRLINRLRLAHAEHKLRLMDDEIAHLQRELGELPDYIRWLQRHEAAQAVIVARLQAAVRPGASARAEVQA